MNRTRWIYPLPPPQTSLCPLFLLPPIQVQRSLPFLLPQQPRFTQQQLRLIQQQLTLQPLQLQPRPQCRLQNLSPKAAPGLKLKRRLLLRPLQQPRPSNTASSFAVDSDYI